MAVEAVKTNVKTEKSVPVSATAAEPVVPVVAPVVAEEPKSKKQEKTLAKEIAEGIIEGLGPMFGGGGGDSFDDSLVTDKPLDYAPRGGIFRLDSDSEPVNAWGDQCDEDGNIIQDRGPRTRQAQRRR